MKLTRPILYANAAALLVNALLLPLTFIKVFPVIIWLVLVIGYLGAAVWYSCYLHGKTTP
jgi:hypothetical protein